MENVKSGTIMENVKSGTIMENVKSEDLATFDWLLEFGEEKFVFERLYNAKGSKEISIDHRIDSPYPTYDIRVGNGKDDKLFYNKNTYRLESFMNGLLYLQQGCNMDNVLILDKQGNIVFKIDNYDLFQRFNLSLIPIKTIWEARNSKITCEDFFHNYKISQGYEFHVDNY